MAQQNNEMRHKGIWFSMVVRGSEYVAFVSGDVLSTHFNAGPTAAAQLASYRENQARINAVAEAKFLSGAERPIKLGTRDFISHEIDCSGLLGMHGMAFADTAGVLAAAELPSAQINLRRYQ
ncbi:MAG: DUF1488 family protein [Janthinobacterium lividum]